jgi:hypothetical protein
MGQLGRRNDIGARVENWWFSLSPGAPVDLHLTRIFKSLGAIPPSSGRSDMCIARQPYGSGRAGSEVVLAFNASA